MRTPVRRAQILKQTDERIAEYLTAEGLVRAKRTLEDLRRERPQAIMEVQRLAELGDFSENVEYQEAKRHLRRLNDRILALEDRIKHAVIIGEGSGGCVALGSNVVVETDGKRKTYRIVGPRETSPSHGRISHLSPLGSALLGHAVGESVTVATDHGDAAYRIIEIK